jgi:negative regulator of sigma-B (phosphoserine phosphatase)
MMPAPHEPAQPILDWGVSGCAISSERESGDAHFVAAFPQGALVAVIDGLGHGPEAAEAAEKAIEVMRHCAQEPVTEIILRCHAELRKTRGAVISLASFHIGMRTMTWLGVGNVEGFLFRAGLGGSGVRESLLLRGGVVGYQLPPLRSVSLPVLPGDILAFATDGISGGFGDRLPLDRSPQQIASEILRLYNKETDDALILVARYLGVQS